MFTDDQLLPLSALQHLLFCERQCALIHVEQVWEENRFTAEGKVLHERVDDGGSESRPGVRIVRSLQLASRALGLRGVADVVEFLRPRAGADAADHPPAADDGDGKIRGDGNSNSSNSSSGAGRGRAVTGQPFPVEYKRGKPKTHHADEVQLCAQALCLEEMFGIAVPCGALYYGKNRKRTDIAFDDTLRGLTLSTAERLHALIASRLTPTAVREKKCDACSLLELCLPDALRFRRGARAWNDRAFTDSLGPALESL
ncbi:MAG: CRISPR-associated protein Cas4 [Verrucomicrobiota bacterium]